MNNLKELFACNVFNDRTMKAYLSKRIYATLSATIKEGKPLGIETANAVADAMKNWAVKKGATHFTHWFQPLTEATAEKHTSFLKTDTNGKAILDFSGKELIKGEPDASSLPSGGLRATFEARGYTAWDPTSYAFIKDDILYIPTAFCSYSGETLDKKTPLLKSMEALNEQALRILRLFGHKNIKSVNCCVGLEQEYFLIDRDLYLKRPDLRLCGRTLVGARSPKGQELDDHYLGAIRPRVKEFMKKLNIQLWKLGIPAQMEHNEAAPGQHEIVSIYAKANLSIDQNQLMMEEMKNVAASLNLACLLHEKPFEGVNGSGKHNNWSLQTDTGINLFEPGDSPSDNIQFLFFMAAVIEAVDKYAGLLRLSTASASNDLRLGTCEAPPPIVSIFLGEELENIFLNHLQGLKAQKKEKTNFTVNANIIPAFPKDSTDRNRTSPIAFTGNKFELRMTGSSFNASGPNIVLNSAVAKILYEYANLLEKSDNFSLTVTKLIAKSYSEHKRIIFNGNCYTDEWQKEAEKRGLELIPSSVEAADILIKKQNVEMLGFFGVLKERELFSRYEVILGNYCKTILLEGRVLLEIINKNVLPDANTFIKELSDTIISMKKSEIQIAEERISEIKELSQNIEELRNATLNLNDEIESCNSISNLREKAEKCKCVILKKMLKVRSYSDEIEKTCPFKIWSLPSYRDLMFSV